ncbi:MAG: hypothetical protein A2163_09655 [Actinobacteria bacterium RBG_13_35_12]|nr:MAG: hypothetical protein A2163_09655 [Actinobacteria bacterium RBG_13_35_12]
MPVPLIGGILAFLTGWFARFLGVQALRFVAWKAILWFIVVSVFPVVIYNVVSGLLSEAFNMYADQVEGYSETSILINLTGCLGWLAVHLKIPESFALILSAAMFRIAVSMIPFIGKM